MIGRFPGSLALLMIAAAALPQAAATARAQPPAPLPPGTSETTVTVVREPATEEPAAESFDRGLLLRLGATGYVPVTGPLAELGNSGYGLRVGGGLYLSEHVAVSVDLTVARLPLGPDEEDGYLAAGAWSFVRGTLPFEGVIHFFAEAGGGVVLAGSRATEDPAMPDPVPVAALGGAVGMELDFFEGVSGEGGLRLEHLWTSGVWSGQDGGTGGTTLVAPYVALDLYL